MTTLPANRLARRSGASYPLSFAQQRLWFLAQLTPGDTAYNAQRRLWFEGALDTAALRRAIDAVVRRHEILRTTFRLAGDRPVQIVGPAVFVPFALMDLEGLTEAARPAALDRCAVAEAARPFDLASGPLLRIVLVRLGSSSHVLLVSMHHIVADGWSFGVFTRDLVASYVAEADGTVPPLPPLPIQYGDYAAREGAALDEAALRPLLAYWRAQVAGGLPRLNLGPDHDTSGGRPRCDAAGAIESFDLPPEVVDALRAVGRQTRTTMFMVVLASFTLLLHHWTDATTVVVSADVGGRRHADTEGLIGLFVNQVVLRMELAGAVDCRDLLARVKTVALGAFAHQDLPFERFVQEATAAADERRRPVSPVHVVYQRAPRPAAHLPGLTVRTMPPAYYPARFDLTLFVRDTPDGLAISLVYRRALFSPAAINTRVQQLRAVLMTIAEHPDSTLQAVRVALANLERSGRQMDLNARKRAGFKALTSIEPKAVARSQDSVRFDEMRSGARLPVVASPAGAPVDLVGWATDHRALVESKLALHGAALFRGFAVESPRDFERVAHALCPSLWDENGEHVRDSLGGRVYTPTFYPPDQKVLWHNENSFNQRWPRFIMFYCERPAEAGGETPLVDSRAVFDAIDPAVRERFMGRQIMYVRNYGSGLGLSWQRVFGTSNRADVERHCRENTLECEWRDGDRLRTRCIRPAVVRHPSTGELVWFNQAQHWHVSCLQPEIRATLVSTLAEEDLPRHCYYGDGSRIDDATMHDICRLYESLEVSYPWQRGDIAVIDNVLTAHARNPFKGERKLCVALGAMTSYADVRVS